MENTVSKINLLIPIVVSMMVLCSNTANSQENDVEAATSTCFTVDGCDRGEKHNTQKPTPPRKVTAKSYKCHIEKNDNAATSTCMTRDDCSDEQTVKSTFEVCNQESETIRITNFTALYPYENFAELVAPILPVTINPDTCLEFEIKPNKDKAFKCGGFADVLLRVESESPDGPITGNIAIGL